MIAAYREGLRVRFPGRSSRRTAEPYVLHAPYSEARSTLLARRPGPDDHALVGHSRRVFTAIVDVGFDDYLVSVYLFADGTISIYSTGGIHSTGLRGAPKVADAAAAILDDVEEAVGGFSPVEDIARVPLPGRGHSQVLVRTFEGDFVGSDRVKSIHHTVATLAAMAMLLTQLERSAVIEGLDRVEAGEVRYRLTPEYRRMRSTLMGWVQAPEQLDSNARVASVVVEIGDGETETVTSLFAFADGSTSLYRSDGRLARGVTRTPGVAEAGRALLDCVESSLSAFGPADLVTLPQPGVVQFVTRARLGEDAEWTELVAAAARDALAEGAHPLSTPFECAERLIRMASDPEIAPHGVESSDAGR